MWHNETIRSRPSCHLYISLLTVASALQGYHLATEQLPFGETDSMGRSNLLRKSIGASMEVVDVLEIDVNCNHLAGSHTRSQSLYRAKEGQHTSYWPLRGVTGRSPPVDRQSSVVNRRSVIVTGLALHTRQPV
jgi:hypothetical protein